MDLKIRVSPSATLWSSAKVTDDELRDCERVLHNYLSDDIEPFVPFVCVGDMLTLGDYIYKCWMRSWKPEKDLLEYFFVLTAVTKSSSQIHSELVRDP